MVYITPADQKRLAMLDTKVNVRTTVTTVFLAVTIVTAVASVIGIVATAASWIFNP